MRGLPLVRRTATCPWLGALVAGALATACAAPLRTLPQDPGGPALDAAEILSRATERCRAISSLTAVIAIRGRVNGQRVRGRVLAGIASPSSIVLDAVAPFGASLFVYTAHEGRATLLLPRERRVLQHDDPVAVLDAIAGVPLDAADLRQVLTGCAPAPSDGIGRQLGVDWRLLQADRSQVYLHRADANAPWRVVAVRHGGDTVRWRADFADFAGALPQTIRLVSDDRRRFDLTLTMSEVEIDVSLGPEVFQPMVPAGSAPISLDELRRAGPFGELRSSRQESSGSGSARAPA